METVTTAILDKFPNLRQFKVWIVLAVAIFGYIGGLIFTTNVRSLLIKIRRLNQLKFLTNFFVDQSGMYWLQLMDKYAANWSVLLIAICECILIAWIYGSERFLNDIQKMIGKRSRLWVLFWSWMWRLITPAALFVSCRILSFYTILHSVWRTVDRFSSSCYSIGWNINQHPMAITSIRNGLM